MSDPEQNRAELDRAELDRAKLNGAAMAGAGPPRAAPRSHRFDPTILREYDIRGVVGKNLGADDAWAIGRSFATVLRRAGGKRVAVGYDGRLSSPMLEAALVEGIIASGVDAVRIGMGPTPMLYYAEASAEDVQGGIQVTGSHNPADHNGFKMVLGGQPFFGADIGKLGEMAAAGDWISFGAAAAGGAGLEGTGLKPGETTGRRETRDVLEAYVSRLTEGLAGLPASALGALRIGWDAGNGAAGPALERLVSKLPGDHHLLFTEVDGRFPNHHPDPTIEENLADLRRLVAHKNLDFGFAFDGDADRVGAIDAHGRVIWGDQLLMILAQDVLTRRPGATVIADVKASQAVFDLIAEAGGIPVMGASGHSLIKSRMKETGALLAGEMSGHLFLADDFYGFDDGLYAAIRLIAASVRLGKSLSQLHEAMPQTRSTPELRFHVDEARKFAAVEEVHARLVASGAAVNAIDGVRVTTADGWWLLRASNTQDVLVARAESATSAGLVRLVAEIDAHLALCGLERGHEAAH